MSGANPSATAQSGDARNLLLLQDDHQPAGPKNVSSSAGYTTSKNYPISGPKSRTPVAQIKPTASSGSGVDHGACNKTAEAKSAQSAKPRQHATGAGTTTPGSGSSRGTRTSGVAGTNPVAAQAAAPSVRKNQAVPSAPSRCENQQREGPPLASNGDTRSPQSPPTSKSAASSRGRVAGGAVAGAAPPSSNAENNEMNYSAARLASENPQPQINPSSPLPTPHPLCL